MPEDKIGHVHVHVVNLSEYKAMIAKSPEASKHTVQPPAVRNLREETEKQTGIRAKGYGA